MCFNCFKHLETTPKGAAPDANHPVEHAVAITLSTSVLCVRRCVAVPPFPVIQRRNAAPSVDKVWRKTTAGGPTTTLQTVPWLCAAAGTAHHAVYQGITPSMTTQSAFVLIASCALTTTNQLSNLGILHKIAPSCSVPVMLATRHSARKVASARDTAENAASLTCGS